MNRELRRLDLGAVSPLRSQALYHGLAETMDETTPDTVVFCSPAAPYFCVGYHQAAEDVLDLALCRRAGWPVLRRKVGGGAVYLDEAQLFYQVVVHRSRAPFAVADIYRRYLMPAVMALRRLGLDVALRGINEIEARGRRIAGTGGGQLGDAVVVVGNVLFDFAHERMARAWRAPSTPFRRLAADGLRRYLTTLRHELPEVPPMAAVADVLAECYGESFARPLVSGGLSPREERAIVEAEVELASEAFVLDRPARPHRPLKIARGVWVGETTVGSGREPFRLTVRVRHGVIDAATATAPSWRRRMRSLVGARLEGGALGERLPDAPEKARLVEALVALGRTSPGSGA